MSSVYYCFGGGFGHVTRYLAFCHTMQECPILLTNSCLPAFATHYFTKLQNNIIFADDLACHSKDSLKSWITEQLIRLKPTTLFIDSFPAGIFGELAGIRELECINCEYIARILKLNKYMERLNSQSIPALSKIWQVEPLEKTHQKWLEQQQIPINKLTLKYNELPENSSELSVNSNTWLIVHSGAYEEQKQLWEFAKQTAEIESLLPELILASPSARPDFLPSSAKHISKYPLNHLFNDADRVFSAAGFNIMQQMRGKKPRHHILPLERALDDQFLRVKLYQVNI